MEKGDGLPDGQALGGFWGRVRRSFVSSDEAAQWGMKYPDDKSIILCEGNVYHVVDARGCVFEFMNAVRRWEDANVHVHPDGRCEIVGGDVACGEELCWWYGEHFVLP